MSTDRPTAPAASRRPSPRVTSTKLPRETVAGPAAKEPCQRIECRTLWIEAPGRETHGGHHETNILLRALSFQPARIFRTERGRIDST